MSPNSLEDDRGLRTTDKLNLSLAILQTMLIRLEQQQQHFSVPNVITPEVICKQFSARYQP